MTIVERIRHILDDAGLLKDETDQPFLNNAEKQMLIAGSCVAVILAVIGWAVWAIVR